MRVGAVRSIVLSAVQEEGGATEVVDAVLQMINWSIRKDVVVAVSSSRWGSLPVKNFHDTTTTSRRPRCAAVHTSLRLLWQSIGTILMERR